MSNIYIHQSEPERPQSSFTQKESELYMQISNNDNTMRFYYELLMHIIENNLHSLFVGYGNKYEMIGSLIKFAKTYSFDEIMNNANYSIILRILGETICESHFYFDHIESDEVVTFLYNQKYYPIIDIRDFLRIKVQFYDAVKSSTKQQHE